MRSLLKIITNYKSILNYINYINFKINVIIFINIFILFGCGQSEKSEKARLDLAHKTVSVIPPSASQSEFLQNTHTKQPAPVYPWSKHKDKD